MIKRNRDTPPQGFALLERFPLVDDEPVRVEILLPQALRDELAEQDRREREEARAKKDEQARHEGFSARKKIAEENYKSLVNSGDEDEIDNAPVPGQDYDPLELMPVYDHAAPERLQQSRTTKYGDRDARERIDSISTKLKLRTNLRQVNHPLDSAGRGRLSELRRSHPHFGDVIDLVENQIVLAQATRTRLSIPPILLWGPPGVGKTHFAQALGEILGTSLHRLAFDSELPGAALLGSDKKWSTSCHGAVFEAVCLGDHANPVLLLDEIDKAYRGYIGADPLASLHSLLEPVSSKTVTDISLDFTFDASSVIWICTANDPRKVAPTLRSRMREFVIEMPDAAQCLQIAQAVGKSVCEAMSVEGLEEPSKRINALLAHLTPREQSQALRQAYALAITSGRLQLRTQDIPAAYVDADGQGSNSETFH